MARVASLLQQLKQDCPNTIINLEIGTSSGERLLLDDKVDIGIYGNLTQNNKVSYKRIDTFHLPVFVSKQFPVDADRLDKQALTQYPQAVLKPSYKSGPTVGVVHEGIQWYVSDHHTKKERIRSGLCWRRIPMHEIENDRLSEQLQQVQNYEQMDVPVYIARLKDKSLCPVGLAVWNFFQSLQVTTHH